ncbi:MAG: DUF1697 domain-containing protein [Pseudomonadota bacterium]
MTDTWVALLRGINVGGHGKIEMATLRRILAARGLRAVETHIQSGNVVFRASGQGAEALAALISQSLARELGAPPVTLVLGAADFARIVAAAPAADDPKTVNLFFLADPAAAVDRAALEALRAPTEALIYATGAIYLSASAGIGRSKLAAALERHVACAVTARNLRSARQIAHLAREVAER